MTFSEIREGVTYAMTAGDGLGGKYYSKSSLVQVITKTAGQPFYCLNLETGVYFYAAGASSFQSAS